MLLLMRIGHEPCRAADAAGLRTQDTIELPLRPVELKLHLRCGQTEGAEAPSEHCPAGRLTCPGGCAHAPVICTGRVQCSEAAAMTRCSLQCQDCSRGWGDWRRHFSLACTRVQTYAFQA